MRCLHFVSVLGDLQEGHVYGKRPRGYTFQCHSPSARAQKWRFCARGWLPRAQQRPLKLSTARHEPCGVHLAAVRQATDCRNLPRNLPPCMLPGTAPVQPTAVCYRRHAYPSDNLPAVHAAATCRQDLPAAHTTVHTAEELPPCATARHTTVHTAVTYPPGHTTLLWVPRPAGG